MTFAHHLIMIISKALTLLLFLSSTAFAQTTPCLQKAVEAAKATVHLDDPEQELLYSTNVIDITELPINPDSDLNAIAEYSYVVRSAKKNASKSADSLRYFVSTVRIQDSKELHRCIVLDVKTKFQVW